MNTVTVPRFNTYLMKNSIAFRASILCGISSLRILQRHPTSRTKQTQIFIGNQLPWDCNNCLLDEGENGLQAREIDIFCKDCKLAASLSFFSGALGLDFVSTEDKNEARSFLLSFLASFVFFDVLRFSLNWFSLCYEYRCRAG